VRDNAKKNAIVDKKEKTIFFLHSDGWYHSFNLPLCILLLSERRSSSDPIKKIRTCRSKRAASERTREKKSPPPHYGPRGNHGCPPEPREKKYKKLLQFSPLRQKRAIFFVYNNNISLCPASLLNKHFCVKTPLSDRKTLI